MKMQPGEEYEAMAAQARNYVWMGAIPLYLELHKDEVVTLPAPAPFMVLAARNGYLPLLVDTIRAHFQGALPPGAETVWFDYNGLPLKWHIPTGVLFDLLCVEPQRPWRLTVHFRTYPSDVLTACDGEDAVKWNFINGLKEASYIMFGNTKSVMNMSQADQVELWRCVMKGDGEGYDRISARLRSIARPSTRGSDASGTPKPVSASVSNPSKTPLRLYIRVLQEEAGDYFDVPPITSWDDVAYATKPIEIPKPDGKVFTLRDALMKAVPHLFSEPPAQEASTDTKSSDLSDAQETISRLDLGECASDAAEEPVEGESSSTPAGRPEDSTQDAEAAAVAASSDCNKPAACGASRFNGIVRIQGIETDLDLPLDWTARNLSGPEQFVHVTIFTWLTRQNV